MTRRPPPARHTPEEAAEMIAQAWSGIRGEVFRRVTSYCRGDLLLVEDVVDEALFAVTTGKRRWPKHVKIKPFLLQTMRSVRSNLVRKRRNIAGLTDKDDWPSRYLPPDAAFRGRTWQDIDAMVRAVAGRDPILYKVAIDLVKWELGQGGGPDVIKRELALSDGDYQELIQRLTRAVGRKRRQQARRP